MFILLKLECFCVFTFYLPIVEIRSRLKVYSTRLRLLHSGLPVRFVVVHSFVVSKCGTSNNISNNKDDQDHDVDHGNLPPALFHACKHTCFARVAWVAELRLIIAPLWTIETVSYQPTSRSPNCLISVHVTTLCRGLAASRLHGEKNNYSL